MKPDLICYDFDGTLCDTMPDISESINVTLKEMGYGQISIEKVRSFVGNGIAKLISRSLAFSIAQETGREMDMEEIERFGKKMKAHYFDHMTDNSDLYEGVPDVLEHFKESAQIVISNKPVKMLHFLLKHYKIDHYFDLVVGGDSIDVCKPDLKVWDYVKTEMKLDGDVNAVMVGDSKPDVEFGLAAGMKTIAVTF